MSEFASGESAVSSATAKLEIRLARLKAILQDETTPGTFEQVVAALFSRLLDVDVAVAKSGFQFGGDAGTAGRQSRHLRIETKRYADSTQLSDRELLGEIDHALRLDPALEAWILAATRAAPEQLEQHLMGKADEVGVPVLVVDWKPNGFPSLAALCTVAPDVLGPMVSPEAKDLAASLEEEARSTLARLKRDVEAWQLGFDALRNASHRQLERLWNSASDSFTIFGQDAAGGAQTGTIRREESFSALSRWWRDPTLVATPAVLLGAEGMGKTWAALDWLASSMTELPVVLVIPSTALAGFGSVTTTALKRFLADHLYELTEARSPSHWLQRLDRLLLRPASEGPVALVFLDGLNQEPDAPWLPLIRQFQVDAFTPRVRVVASTRTHFFEQRLTKMTGLVTRPVQMHVDRYTPEELDERLAREGLARDALHADLVPFAAVPRLFALVVRFRERLVESGEVTVHRLLWEYGRDTLGIRAGTSFSEHDWRAWLREVAQKARDGIKRLSLKQLGESTARPDLTHSDVYRRLSDIIDSDFASAEPDAGDFTLSPVLVEHALGAALLADLDALTEPNREQAENLLAEWGDPIFGLDQLAEIRRAAVSIMVEREEATPRSVAAALLADWMQSQHLPQNHRDEICRLAGRLDDELLEVLSQRGNAMKRAVTFLCVRALRSLPRADIAARTKIVEACTSWLCHVSRDVMPLKHRNAESEKARSDRMMRRLGADEDGLRQVVGVQVELHERLSDYPRSVVPSLLDGFPLAEAMPVFEAAAISHAIWERNDPWRGLKWLCLLNPIDFEATARTLGDLSQEVLGRTLETGIDPDLRTRVAALLLWMSGDDDLALNAGALDAPVYEQLSYERDYLADPARSFIRLEKRHARQVLLNKSLGLNVRIRRIADHWPDMQLEVPQTFIDEVVRAAKDFDVTKLDTQLGRSSEDLAFEMLEPVVARCSPEALAALVRRKLTLTGQREGNNRYVFAINTSKYVLLADEAVAAAAKELRTRGSDENADESHNDTFARSSLLLLEIVNLPPVARVIAIVQADLRVIFDFLTEAVGPLTRADVDTLVDKFGNGTTKETDDLLTAIFDAAHDLSNDAWEWMVNRAFEGNPQLRGIAFGILHRVDPVRFGRILHEREWQWDPAGDRLCNHCGTLALGEATAGLPFEQTVGALAPWLVLHCLTLRGGSPDDSLLAASVMGAVIALPQQVPEPGAKLFVHSHHHKGDLEAISVLPIEDEEDDVVAALQRSFDFEQQRKVRRLAAETAWNRIREARASGTSLYLYDFQPEDFATILTHARQHVFEWLQGMENRTGDFRRRVHLAEGFYLALCEAMLRFEPAQGMSLWYALNEVMLTTFVGEGKISQLELMLFRAPRASSIDHALDELYDLERTNTDKALLSLAIAAMLGDRRDWLHSRIAEDHASGVAWRAQRALKLGGFLTGAQPPVNQSWADGRSRSGLEDRQREAASWLQCDAMARHWWDQFWSAETAEVAYAAWTLFQASADRRAYTWMREAALSGYPLSKRKQLHVSLNWSRLEKAMERRENRLETRFLSRDTDESVNPWYRA